MTLGEKITKLRKENNYTQEQLAEIMEVSRQSISKWESDMAYPETEKIIRLAKLFNVSTDYLLNSENENRDNSEYNQRTKRRFRFERQSKKMVRGVPLWHIGKNARGIFAIGLKARGVFAIGLAAKGIFSWGLASMGVFSFGMVSLGLISAGLFSLGGLSFGCISAGIMSFGAISCGIVAVGAIAVGQFSVGALAIGNYAAIGDVAKAQIAMGDSEAIGSCYAVKGDWAGERETVRRMLDDTVPSFWNWAKAIFKMFI